MNYTKIAGQSSVDMLRFRWRFDGKPEEALEWFQLLHADMVVEFDRRRDNHGHAIVRYPISLRVGTYREMMKVPGFVSINFSGNIGIIKTRPGYASSIAWNIDNSDVPEILGTIAGDDTIFIVIKEGIRHQDVIEALSDVVPNMK